MEWIEITARSMDEARERALDQLGVADDEVEIEVIDEPRAGLFGLMRGEARIRARIRPADMRSRPGDRRRGRRRSGDGGGDSSRSTGDRAETGGNGTAESGSRGRGSGGGGRRDSGRNGGRERRRSEDRPASRAGERGDRRSTGRDDDESAEAVDPAAVGAAAVTFMEGLVDAFGFQASVELLSDGVDLDVRVDGQGLGLLVGNGGRTLVAVQDLARVAAQRRLGDQTTRLKIDVAGYRERRREALEKFARSVAEEVRQSGVARAMEPMPSADRKVVHDVLVDIDGVSSRSEGDDPDRRVIVSPSDD